MGIILLSLLDVISIAFRIYTIGLIVYSILCLLAVQTSKRKDDDMPSKAHAVLSAFYEPLTAPIRRKLNFKVDVSGIVLLLIIYFIQNIFVFSGLMSFR